LTFQWNKAQPPKKSRKRRRKEQGPQETKKKKASLAMEKKLKMGRDVSVRGTKGGEICRGKKEIARGRR